MQIDHAIQDHLLHNRVRMLIVGAGGTGSAFLLNLPYLHQALTAWGHPRGLEVTVMDGDTVSENNCVRQPFAVSDIGHNKATVLVSRLNLFWGLNWSAVPRHFTRKCLLTRSAGYDSFDIVVGCVDSRAARREITAAVTSSTSSTSYYLDLGNNSSSGQFVLGQPLNSRNRRRKDRLRIVSELFPEMLDEEEDPLPSCSATAAINAQEPFVNQTLAVSALSMLTRLFRYGRIPYQGAFWSAETGRMVSLVIDPDQRRRLSRATERRKAA
jgi:PRTRC genetic system ThiF family protein